MMLSNYADELKNTTSTTKIGDILQQVVGATKAEVGRIANAWIDRNLDKVIFQKKVLFYTVKIRVRDVEHIFEKIFKDEDLSDD